MNTTTFKKIGKLSDAPLTLLLDNIRFKRRETILQLVASPLSLIAVVLQPSSASQIQNTPLLPSTISPYNNVKVAIPIGSITSLQITPNHIHRSFPQPRFFSSISGNGTCSFEGLRSDDDDDDFKKEGDDDDDKDDDDELESQSEGKCLTFIDNVKSIVALLHDSRMNGVAARRSLEKCEICVTPDLVLEVLLRLRNDHVAAYTFFLWAVKQPNYNHTVHHYNAMISILAKYRKFDTAWALIDEMRMLSLVTPRTLVIMIRRYSAVHDVGKAINTFYAFKRFGFEIRIKEFHELLSALCRYKNVEDAEHLLRCNEDTFPVETKSFNIVLNGWCNTMVNVRQAMRLWKEMVKRGIPRDAYSYSSIISCYAKVGNLNSVLRMFNLMKDEGVAQDRKAYNPVIYALARRGHNYLNEAMKLVTRMEQSKGEGQGADVATYNSLIKALCKVKRVNDARSVLNRMQLNCVSPSVKTYHPLLRVAMNAEEAFGLLDEMRSVGCVPVIETYLMLIRKFCRWRQLNTVLKLWNEIHENGLSHDRSAYSVLINGLFLNGSLEEAWRYCQEMQAKGFEPEPKIEETLKAWVSGKAMTNTDDTVGAESNHHSHHQQQQ